MKGRFLEKIIAVLCALTVAVGVMSGVVFARDRDEDPSSEPDAPEATFTVVDLDPASPDFSGEFSANDTEILLADTPAPMLEVTDNRDEIPLQVDGEPAGECPIIGGIPYVSAEAFCRAAGLTVSAQIAADQPLTHCTFFVTEKDSVREQDCTSTGILFEACNNVLQESIVSTALWRNS